MSDTQKSSILERSLSKAAYCDHSRFAEEKTQLFSNEWACIGREEDISEPETAIVVELLGESIIVARLSDGSLRAHYNVCRHRGARLCENDSKWDVKLNGGVDRSIIRCPYHQWAYSLDGSLKTAPHLSRSPGFDKSEYSLYPAGIGTWGGFIFLKLSPEDGDEKPRELDDLLGKAPERLRNYPLSALKTAEVRTYDVDANWKVIAENYNECYHCGGVHPELCEIVPTFRLGGGLDLDWEKGIPHREDAWTYTFTGTTNRKPFATLDEDERVRHKGEIVYPNLMLSMSAEHGAAFILWPLAPGKSRVECRFLFDPAEMKQDDFDPSDAVEFWDITNRQDWAVCERVQSGMMSQSFRQGFYAPMEDESLDIRRYLSKFLKDDTKS